MDRSRMIDRMTGRGTGLPRPASVGQKFTASGEVMPFAGNTFICHIPPASPAHAALCDTARALAAAAPQGAFAYLPPSSYHMTVFEGICDIWRTGERWPRGLDPALSVEEVSRAFAPRIAGLDLPPARRVRPLGVFAGYSVALTGADAAEEAALRATRNVLREATGIWRSDHDDYGFHITLAYPLRWLSEAEAEAMAETSLALGRELAARIPEIALGPVEFCRFADMHAFDPALPEG